ncbi:hypothetical protein RR42_s1132 [Cupriavidus basilensis]|uniref:Uncharacterized protein n=1 Tax=Cupriavidus basilensis TaxID=68895 RepID=A0A0C4YQ52_9BURK|nr:hypothetical protein RR42_s1132 [Cupriavidus basilensis]
MRWRCPGRAPGGPSSTICRRSGGQAPAPHLSRFRAGLHRTQWSQLPPSPPTPRT